MSDLVSLPNPRYPRLLATGPLSEPRICGTPSCVGMPEPAQDWCPYCLSLVSEYDRREQQALEQEYESARRAHLLFARLPGRIDVDAAAAGEAIADGCRVLQAGPPWLNPVQRSALGLFAVATVCLLTLPWVHAGVAMVALWAGWMFRATAVDEDVAFRSAP